MTPEVPSNSDIFWIKNQNPIYAWILVKETQ